MGFLVNHPFYIPPPTSDLNQTPSLPPKLNKKSYGNSLPLLIRYPSKYLSKAHVPLYTGLTTGVCGSITSLSSFVFELFQLASNTSSDVHFAFPNPGWGVLVWFAYAIITLSVSAASFTVGRHFAMILVDFCSQETSPTENDDDDISRAHHHHHDRRGLSLNFIHITQDVLAVVGLLAWIIAIVLSILSTNNGITTSQKSKISVSWRYWSLSMAFSPCGVFARYWVSKILNPRVWTSKFMLGTFTCNVLATIILAVLAILSYGGNGAAVSSTLSCDVIQALINGFCGSFSTVSTLITEMFTLKRESGWIFSQTFCIKPTFTNYTMFSYIFIPLWLDICSSPLCMHGLDLRFLCKY